MAQYKVPQDTQREDQIFGPFTLRQFLFFLGAAMAGYMTYVPVSKIAGGQMGIMVGALSFSVVAAFAVVKVQGMPLPEYLTALIVFYTKPRKRVWEKDIFTPDIAFFQEETVLEDDIQLKDPTEVKSRLDQLAHVLDTGGWSNIQENIPAPEMPATLETNEISPSAETVEVVEKENIQDIPLPESPSTLSNTQTEPIKNELPKVPSIEDIKLENMPQKEITKPELTEVTDKKQEEIEKLLQIQEKRERLIQEEMNKMEQKLMQELSRKFEKETQEQTKQQSKKIKELKTKVASIEKVVEKEKPLERVEKAEIRVEPQIEKSVQMPDFSKVMEGRIATPHAKATNVNISVNENELDDILSQIENPTTEEEFDKLSEAILAKKHTPHHAKIIKEKE